MPTLMDPRLQAIIFLAVLACCSITNALAAIAGKSIKPPAGMTKMEIWHETNCPPKNGILVLCPGMNIDGKFFLNEQSWRNFAREQGLGLMAISFASDPELLYGANRKGYYYPEEGSGPALLDAINDVYGHNSRLILYGFSGGAQFVSRFVDKYPEKILTWAAYSASFWAHPASASPLSPPGIVACGEFDYHRFGASYSYFNTGRAMKARWTWVSIPSLGHVRSEKLEVFIRSYIRSYVSSDAIATWWDQHTRSKPTLEQLELYPALSVWLPSNSLIDAWEELNNQSHSSD